MADLTMSLPYQSDASINATLLLQKQVFQSQTNSLSKLLSHLEQSKLDVIADVKVPQLLTSRTLSDEYASSSRLLENEEVALLGFLDVNGKLTVSSRLNEFMLFMTRISKAEHRALCINIITSKTSELCKKDFTKFGGLRIVKRWLKIAEEGDFITEMTALVKLCNKLPFDEGAIREIGIGKVIRKLLKFQSPSGGDVTGLRAQVEALMANWRAKQQEFASAGKAVEAKTEALSDKAPDGLVLAISDRLVKQRGLPAQTQPEPRSADSVDKNESKDDPSPRASDTAMEVDGHNYNSQNSTLSTSSVIKTEPATGNAPSTAASTSTNGNGSAAAGPKPVSILSSLRAAQTAAAAQLDENGAAMETSGDAPPVLVIRPPVARERKPLNMAEKARSMLAMRAQHALTGAASASLLNGEPASPTGSFGADGAPPLSPSTSNVLSILSAVGKARIASGLQTIDQAPPVVLKGAMKKPSEDGVKKEKKAIHWADENGGLLREVRTIEVAKIKRSTAHYSSTRELSKRERLAEKETHLSKAEDAMQKNTEWRTPAPLSLSIVVLDNISIVADSAEKVAQEKRLAHVLEVRYALDTQIPTDPDEGPSVHEPTTSSSARSGTPDGTTAGDDGAANIPWYAPGTEPPPEETAAPSLSVMDLLRAHGGYLDDAALVEILSKLPYDLQALEMGTLRSLLQDNEALQTVLRHDNTVDETALATFKRSLELASRGRSSRFEHYDPGAAESGGRKSRWGGEEGPVGGYPPNQSYDFDYDYDPYGPPRSRDYGDYDRDRDRPPVGGGWSTGYDAPPAPRSSLSVVDMRDRRHAAPQGRFPTTKAATACRFFNTAKGCQFGDKCSFGHFLPNDAPPRAMSERDAYVVENAEVERARWGGPGHSGPGHSGPAHSGPGARRFGDMPRQTSGPGSRLHSQTVDLTAKAAGGADVVDLTNGNAPAKRAKTRFN